MTARIITALCVFGVALLAAPAAGYAQEATLTGTIADSTGGVLPGVTVTVVHEATGNRFVAVTDERGIYRIPARVGGYQMTAELSGFTTLTRSGLQLLVGQTATVDLQMTPSTIQETVTVSAAAPLLNVATSNLGGNISPEQVQELPVQGRNWMALAMLAPGSRMTSDASATPVPDRNIGEQREFQLTLDGQQVSSERGFGGQPRYSQDAIAEFQYISNRFDATLGRSSGVQVRAVTRSGTNAFSGSVRGNFRDSRFNAENPVLNRVVPIDNQQIAFTAGGPVLRDRLHFFGHFEYEREPRVSIWNTPFARFNVELEGNDSVKLGGGRLDYQLSPGIRLMGKISQARKWQPFGVGGQNHPAETGSQADVNSEYLGQLTHVLSNRAVNEIKGGFTKYYLRPGQPHVVVEPLAGGHAYGLASGGRHDRVPPHHLHGLHDCGQPVLPPGRRADDLERARRFHALLRCARTPRPQGRRRAAALPRLRPQLPPLHGRASTPEAVRCPPTSRRSSRMRSTRIRGISQPSPRSSGPTTSAWATSSPTTPGRRSACGCRTTGTRRSG